MPRLLDSASSGCASPDDIRSIGVGRAVARHLTALVRSGFSAPIQALARYGLINDHTEVFDYGCGRGDDVRGLVANGITARGWDPHYAPNEPKRTADIVNLGFVINVIEDFDERVEAARCAFALTKKVLAISAMLASQATNTGRPYRDGFLTSRNTFQKYYTQAQLAEFINAVLDEEPIAVSPGVFFIFRDKDAEQSFLAGRQRNATLLQRLLRTETVKDPLPRPDLIQLQYETNREALERRCPHAHSRNTSNSKLRLDHAENGAAKNPINKPVQVVSRMGSTSTDAASLLSLGSRLLAQTLEKHPRRDLAVYSRQFCVVVQLTKQAPSNFLRQRATPIS
jgi:DNA phosphorothioation-associated putative methyltransferase